MGAIWVMIFVSYLSPTFQEVHLFKTRDECEKRIETIYKSEPGGRRDFSEAYCVQGDVESSFSSWEMYVKHKPQVDRYHVH